MIRERLVEKKDLIIDLECIDQLGRTLYDAGRQRYGMRNGRRHTGAHLNSRFSV